MAKSTTKKHKNAGNEIQTIDENLHKKPNKEERLKYWQDKYADSYNAYQSTLQDIDELFNIYEGTGDIYKADGSKAPKGTSSVRKVAFELVEAQVDVTIPQPKVISLAGNEERAMTVEHFLMNEIDRLPFEKIADIQGRITPIVGSSFTLVEWDNSIKTKNTVGKLKVTNLDPKCVIPQKGKTSIDDSDYIFIRMLESKASIKNRYGIDISQLEYISQTETDMDETHNDELVTHIYCFYKDENGNICLFSWVDNYVINDLENYFARKEYKCTKCGRTVKKDTKKCECGNTKFELQDVINEEITITVDVPETILGIPTGRMTKKSKTITVPYYIPKVFPVVKRDNVSKRNSFLGSSDVNIIKDQQNDLNITMRKIKEKLLKGGSIVTIPEKSDFKATDEELKIIRVKSPSEAQLIDAKAIQPNISTDMGILELNYNIARQTIGITDSFQGRYDSSATSGKAKQISAERSAGRLKSKQDLKNDCYADLYRVMFYFMLAYADELQSIYYQDDYGKMQYKMFDKRMFIDVDADGNYFYDDELVFDTDESSTLANDRQWMWQQTRDNFMSGAYGDPTDASTLVMYWQMMNTLHYPGAKQALEYATQRLEQQQQAAQVQQEQQASALQMQNDTAYANAQAKQKAADANMMKSRASAVESLLQQMTPNKETTTEEK